MPHIDFGLCFNFRNPKPFGKPFPEFYEETLQQIEAAESLGFDTVWLPEHHFSPEDGYNPSPLAMAGWYEESAMSGHDPVLLDFLQSGEAMRPPGIGEMVVPDASHSIRAIERKLEEAPYTHLVFGGGNTTPSGLPAEEMLPYLERFAREVIPYFR
ncbi:LLM class flavin-dependent oxidoreductase [Myxococcota bacterium]|nr:LLM class flavin-dependent oxidoreductase [Myxococcota bacterium]